MTVLKREIQKSRIDFSEDTGMKSWLPTKFVGWSFLCLSLFTETGMLVCFRTIIPGMRIPSFLKATSNIWGY